jgi:gentisate 1,2-dioxygenase
MPTMAAFVQLLPAGFAGSGCRSTDGAVFHVIEGAGSVTIAGERLTFDAHDSFVVPAWAAYRLEASAESVLFSFSDRPLQRAMGVWREQLVQ